jgi:hypothetical protein
MLAVPTLVQVIAVPNLSILYTSISKNGTHQCLFSRSNLYHVPRPVLEEGAKEFATFQFFLPF